MNEPRQPIGVPGHQPPPIPQHRPMPAAPVPHLPGSARPGIAPMPVQPIRPNESDLDPIELVEDELNAAALLEQSNPTSRSKIKQFGVEAHRAERAWKRAPHTSGSGAVRVKSFHGKYSDQGVEHLDDVINDWLDNHPEVEVKFVTSTVHVFEGKIREPALVLNLWY
jgi:hypothetical protein